MDVRVAQQATTRAARALDAALATALGQPLVVAGSLPPDARDLDLLVPPAERPAVERALRAAGLVPAAGGWGDGAAEVELLDGLPAAEHAAVRAASQPLPGLERLRRPAAHHALLLLAVQRAATGRLDLRRRARVARALAEDPGAWERAAQAAPAWGARASLAWLRAAYEGDGAGGRVVRARAAGERLRADAVPLAGLRAVRGALRPVRLPVPVVALSGLDGSGKSTQARLLVAALQDAGLDAVVLWDRISYSDALLRLTTPLRAVLRLLPRATDRLAADVVLKRNDDPDGPYAVPDDHRALRGLRRALPAAHAAVGHPRRRPARRAPAPHHAAARPAAAGSWCATATCSTRWCTCRPATGAPACGPSRRCCAAPPPRRWRRSTSTCRRTWRTRASPRSTR